MKKVYSVLKSIAERLLAGMMLVILTPIMLCVALLSLLLQGKPVVFSQQRPGYRSQPFTLYKFRTMHTHKKEQVTKFGKLLRKFSLDELPQLLNIVKGELSFIGPRPLLMEYLPLYTPEQARRHDVKPGITGWAQVNGRNNLSWEQKFSLDLWYVKNCSLWVDLKILLLTIANVLTAKDINKVGHNTTEFFTGSNKAATLPTWPQFADDEIQAASSVLASGKVNYWTSKDCQQFEQNFAKYLGVEHAVAVANGSVALEIALAALELRPNDEVIVPARTFVASASSIVQRGGKPVFADVDLVSHNITADTIQPLISHRTRGIIVVHLAGIPCDMQPIIALAKQHKLWIIEDCAQAHGAKYHNQAVGTFGDIATFSFCQDKIMTTGGEGGMLATNSTTLWQKAWSYKDHGKNIKLLDNNTPRAPGEFFRWVHDTCGTNYRMTAMQAAIGDKQLAKLDSWVERRRANAQKLQAAFTQQAANAMQIYTYTPPPAHYASYYKFYFSVPAAIRNAVIDDLQQQQIPCGVGSCPEVYREKLFAKLNFTPSKRLANAKLIGETCIMLPVHPDLSAHIDYIATTVINTVKQHAVSRTS